LKKILNQNARLNAKLDILISGQKKLEKRIIKLEEDYTKHIGIDKTFEKVSIVLYYSGLYFFTKKY
jgi:hypothetical protein